MNPNRGMALILAILAAIAGATMLSERGPFPLAVTAPTTRFSAGRAVAALDDILRENAPHPVGTPAHDIVRDRIAERLRALGYETSMQQTIGCNAHATCAAVANIMARLPGDARADTLAVVAHYDSVAAGPGASDDGIGMATVLEIARAVRHEHFRNSILFLITDGEELGLLGAEAFVTDPTVSRGVAAVINVDNRGTSGRSFLFETSAHNRWLVQSVADALPRPSTSSLFYAMYQLLPNDTDLSVFKRSGMAGINFACVGHVAHYHTPLDNLQHVTPSTVQDHGDHMLSMTRALGNADLRQTSDGDAVFFDLFSLGIAWWPQEWTRWLDGAAFVLLLVAAAVRMRDHKATAASITSGVVSFFLAVIAAAVLGGGAAWIASLRASSAAWVAQPGPSIATMWLIGVATAVVCARLLYARAGFDGLFIGHGVVWAANRHWSNDHATRKQLSGARAGNRFRTLCGHAGDPQALRALDGHDHLFSDGGCLVSHCSPALRFHGPADPRRHCRHRVGDLHDLYAVRCRRGVDAPLERRRDVHSGCVVHRHAAPDCA